MHFGYVLFVQEPAFSELKYLGFFEIAADRATKYVANVYGFAKESSGRLKPSVEGVETSVKTAVKPVYERIEGKPHEILLFVDKKVTLLIPYLIILMSQDDAYVIRSILLLLSKIPNIMIFRPCCCTLQGQGSLQNFLCIHA